MNKQELIKEVNNNFKNLKVEITEKQDFNHYNISFIINNEIINLEYIYNNHWTIVGNSYKIIDIIQDKILKYYKGE